MGALNGLKILDFSTLLPGPYATLVLADLGAEVVKVSSRDRYDLVTHWPPVIEGTDITAAAAWLGRNKKTICMDLKRPAAVEAVKRLIEEYDILLEQFRPGVMDRLGLGYETLKEINPRLIYCSLTGYGQTGPLRDRAGHDINYMARSGVLDAAGRKEGGPVLTNMQVADVAVGSMNTVVSILAAVYHRQQTGKGQYIDVSMLDGMVPFNSMDGACFLAGAVAPQREGQLLNGGGVYDFYETKDGGYMSVGALEPKFFARLCQAMDCPQWADGAILKTDLPLVKQTLREKFRTKTKAEWTEIFSNFDACVEPVMTPAEILEDEHVKERGLLPDVTLPVTVDHSAARTVKQLGCPIKLADCPPEYRHAGYPEGWHTHEVLSHLGYTDAEIDAMGG